MNSFLVSEVQSFGSVRYFFAATSNEFTFVRSLNSIILLVSSDYIFNVDDDNNRPKIFNTCFLPSFAYCSEGSFILLFLGRSLAKKFRIFSYSIDDKFASLFTRHFTSTRNTFRLNIFETNWSLNVNVFDTTRII